MRKARPMTNDPRPVVDQRLVRALAHPSRVAILETLTDEKGLGLNRISEKLALKPANVSYHANVLVESGVIEAVPAGRGGATEQVFRLTPRSPIGNQPWGEISDSMRGEISTVLLQSFMERARNFPPGYDVRGA